MIKKETIIPFLVWMGYEMYEKVEYMNQTAYQELLDRAEDVVKNPIAFLNAAEDFTNAFAAHKRERNIFGFKSYENKIEYKNGYSRSTQSDSYDSVQYKQIANKITITDDQMWKDLVASNPNHPATSLIRNLYFHKTREDLRVNEGNYKESLNLQRAPQHTLQKLKAKVEMHLTAEKVEVVVPVTKKSSPKIESNYMEHQNLVDRAKDIATNPIAFLKAAANFTSAFKLHKSNQGINGEKVNVTSLVEVNDVSLIVYGNTYDDGQYEKIAAQIEITEDNEKIWANLVASNPDNPEVISFLKTLYAMKTGKELEGGENIISLNLIKELGKSLEELENFLQGARITSALYGCLDYDFEEFYNANQMGEYLKSMLDTIFTDCKSIIKTNRSLLDECGKALNQLKKLAEDAPCVNSTLESIDYLYAENSVLIDPKLDLARHKAKLESVIISRQGLFNSAKNKTTLETALTKLKKAGTLEKANDAIVEACRNYKPRFPPFDAIMDFLFGKSKTNFASEMEAIVKPFSPK